MPYIPDLDRRAALDVGETFAQNVGELNYRITRILDSWLSKVGVSYTHLNRAVGEIEACYDWSKLPPEGTPGRAIMNEISRFIGTNKGDKTDIKGVLRCAQLELERRIISVYEDMKITENTDVYTIFPRRRVGTKSTVLFS
jgi:hypothetical protein